VCCSTPGQAKNKAHTRSRTKKGQKTDIKTKLAGNDMVDGRAWITDYSIPNPRTLATTKAYKN